MKAAEKDKVRWLLEAFMAEHRAACPHFNLYDKTKCPTEAKYAEARELLGMSVER